MFMEHPVDPSVEIYIREWCKFWKVENRLLSELFTLKLWVWNCIIKFYKGKGQNSVSTYNETSLSLGA